MRKSTKRISRYVPEEIDSLRVSESKVGPASLVAYHVKPLPVMLASCIRIPVGVLTANPAPWEKQRKMTLATHVSNLGKAPGFSLAQLWRL